MTTKYVVFFSNGKRATMLDMQGRGLESARKGAIQRFGKDRVIEVRELTK